MKNLYKMTIATHRCDIYISANDYKSAIDIAENYFKGKGESFRDSFIQDIQLIASPSSENYFIE